MNAATVEFTVELANGQNDWGVRVSNHGASDG